MRCLRAAARAPARARAEIDVLRQLAIVLIVRRLQHGERTARAELRQGHLHAHERQPAGRRVGRGRQDVHQVHRFRVGGDVSRALIGRVAVAHRNRDGRGMEGRRDVRGQLDRPVRRFHRDHVAARDAELGGGLGRDLDPRVPHRLRHRIRRFLEPRADRASPVVEPERRIREKRQTAAVAVELRGRRIAPAIFKVTAAGAPRRRGHPVEGRPRALP